VVAHRLLKLLDGDAIVGKDEGAPAKESECWEEAVESARTARLKQGDMEGGWREGDSEEAGFLSALQHLHCD
jgi:hypothetical protein